MEARGKVRKGTKRPFEEIGDRSLRDSTLATIFPETLSLLDQLDPLLVGAMGTDLRQLLPRDKSDFGNARALVALGYPAVAPVLKDLLAWLQDGNWPISRLVGDFFLTIPEAIAPLVREVLEGDDLQWKYWCIVRLIGQMPPTVATQFRDELTRLAEFPTAEERLDELDAVARDALFSLGFGLSD